MYEILDFMVLTHHIMWYNIALYICSISYCSVWYNILIIYNIVSHDTWYIIKWYCIKSWYNLYHIESDDAKLYHNIIFYHIIKYCIMTLYDCIVMWYHLIYHNNIKNDTISYDIKSWYHHMYTVVYRILKFLYFSVLIFLANCTVFQF